MFSFCKMQATGNDFIIVDCLKKEFEYSYKLLSEFLCDRHFGVGADGVLFIEESNTADLKMRIFNKDGSEAKMCGNGIRCFAKYVYEHNILKKENFKIETISGIKDVKLFIEGKTAIKVKIDMGEPEFNQNRKSVIIDNLEFFIVSIGNPHAVCFVQNLEEINIEKIGRKVENSKYFPDKTNVEFVEIINEKNIRLKVWERGVGKTLSCGTGACASSIICNEYKSTKSEINVDLEGGNLKVYYNKENKKIYLEGDAKEVFVGKINI